MMTCTGLRILKPKGYLSTTTAAKLLETFQDCFDAQAEVILINLQQVDFVDSSGLGILIQMHTKLRLAGRRLCLCSANDQVKTILDISDLDRILDIFPDQATVFEAVLD
jgi:anti-anti-sigma factor